MYEISNNMSCEINKKMSLIDVRIQIGISIKHTFAIVVSIEGNCCIMQLLFS